MSKKPNCQGTHRWHDLVGPPARNESCAPIGGLASSRSSWRANEAIARCYEPMKGEVVRSLRSKLFGCGLRFDAADLEAFYNAAWMTLYTALSSGETIEAPGGFLVVVAFCRAIDEARRATPRLWADWADAARLGVAEDLAGAMDDRASIRSYLEALNEALTIREREALILCMFCGYTRPRAAGLMDMPPKRMERIMDDAQVKLRPQVAAIKDGRWCAMYESRLRAMAAGLLDKEGKNYRTAVQHLRACPACRAELRRMRQRAA
jgi:DNA-directed RNA polymerase specialized sigma24 family protein